MSQVLFVNVFGYGHVKPTLSLVKELIDKGEKVTYLAGEEFREKIERVGARFEGYPNFAEFKFQNGNIGIEECEPIIFEFTRIYVKIVDIIFRLPEKMDYMIYDSLFFLGKEVAGKLNIPAISSHSTFATNEHTNFLSMLFSKTVVDKLLGRAEFLESIKYLQQKYGIMVPNVYQLHTLKADLNIVYTSRYFQPHGETFDESYRFIGPPMIESLGDLDLDFIKGIRKKLIYISFGTIFNRAIDFYEKCFQAFQNMDAIIVMSVGESIDIAAWKSMPSNFIVCNYVPQIEILKETDVFITHGGMNSVNEALYYGVPLIIIPQFFDQPVVAHQVAALGAGIVLQKDNIIPEQLKQSVDRILSDSRFASNSEQIGKTLQEGGGCERAVHEILGFINRNQAKQLEDTKEPKRIQKVEICQGT